MVVRNFLIPLFIWLLALISLTFLKLFGKWDLSGIAALIFFLIIPSFLEKSNEALGLKFIWKDNVFVFIASFIFFAIPYLIIFIAGGIQIPYVLDLQPRIPDLITLKWFGIFLIGVAFPEEFFFRGFLQGRLNLFFGKEFRFFGISFGWGLILSSLLFMLIHLPQGLGVVRFLTFFPGLLFGIIREKYGSIFPAVIVHAFSNTFVILVGDL